MNGDIDQFLRSRAFAVAGASKNREKYGNKVLRCYLQHGKTVYPIHPTEERIEELACVKAVEFLPAPTDAISIVTPPSVTTTIVNEAIGRGITQIWMQPGAESAEAISLCAKNSINLIAGGPCLLVVLGYRDAGSHKNDIS